MNKLIIEQGSTLENVNHSTIKKLYKLLIENSEFRTAYSTIKQILNDSQSTIQQKEELTNTIRTQLYLNFKLTGNLSVNRTEKTMVDTLTTVFPDLHITVTDQYYVEFSDPVLLDIMIDLYSSDGIGVLLSNILNITDLSTIVGHSLYNNIQILDLRVLPNVLNVDWNFLFPTNCKAVMFNKILGSVSLWGWTRTNYSLLTYVYTESAGNSTTYDLFFKGPANDALFNAGNTYGDTFVLGISKTGKSYNYTTNGDPDPAFQAGPWGPAKSNVTNLYLNVDKYLRPRGEYFNLNGYSNTKIQNLYVPSSVYSSYSTNWEKLYNNIYEYDFEADPHNILPDHVTIQ